jgi:hypothetical protein
MSKVYIPYHLVTLWWFEEESRQRDSDEKVVMMDGRAI